MYCAKRKLHRLTWSFRQLYSGRLNLGSKACSEYAGGVRGSDITDHFARGVKLVTELNGEIIFQIMDSTFIRDNHVGSGRRGRRADMPRRVQNQ